MLIITKPNGDKKFYCPGCKKVHKMDKRWRLSGTVDKPTVVPKIMSVTLNFEKGVSMKCKVEITDGMLIYDNEVTMHELKGKTIPMEPIPQLEDVPVYAPKEPAKPETSKVAETDKNAK